MKRKWGRKIENLLLIFFLLISSPLVKVSLAQSPPPLTEYPVGNHPFNVLHLNESVWITDYYGNKVTRLRISDGAQVGSTSVGNFPHDLVTDGTTVWVTEYGGGIRQLSAANGDNLGVIPAPDPYPWSIEYDGSHLWVTSYVTA